MLGMYKIATGSNFRKNDSVTFAVPYENYCIKLQNDLIMTIQAYIMTSKMTENDRKQFLQMGKMAGNSVMSCLKAPNHKAPSVYATWRWCDKSAPLYNHTPTNFVMDRQMNPTQMTAKTEITCPKLHHLKIRRQ